MSGAVHVLGLGRAALQSAGTAYVLFSTGVMFLWFPPLSIALWAAAATDLLLEPLVFRGERVADCPRCRRETPAGRTDRGEFRCRHCGGRCRLIAGRAYAF